MKNIWKNIGLMVPYRYLKSVMRRVLFVFDSLYLHDVYPKKDVALIRLDAIGDFIIWLDSAKEFRAIYPSERIVLIANSSWASLAMTLPYWDEVWPIDTVRFTRFGKYRFECLKKISVHGFRLAIHPAYSRMTPLGDSVIRATKATDTIAPSRDLQNNVVPATERNIVDAWCSRIVPSAQVGTTELDRNGDFLNKLIDGKIFEPSLPRLTTLQSNSGLGDYFIVVPGAAWQGRMWSASNFCTVILRVREKYGLRAVLCGAIGELTLCELIVNEVQGDVINLAGKTSLQGFAELIAGAHLVVTNETSAVHFATAVGTPSVCVVGGGHFGRFVPYSEKLSGVKPIIANFHMSCYGCNWSCTQQYDERNAVPCIDNISVNDVLFLIDKAINRSLSNCQRC